VVVVLLTVGSALMIMHPKQTMKILACQVDIPATKTREDRDRHLIKSRDKVLEALQKETCDLVVLPELTSIDYSRDAFEQLHSLAERLDGPSFEIWSDVARSSHCHVVYSFPRRVDNTFRIAVAVISPDGDLSGVYDKIYLAQYGASMEKEYFEPGTDLLCFDVAGFTVAPIVCADIRIPELSRTLTVEHKADVILHCGAYFRDESFVSWHNFAITRAIENQIYFCSVNRAGENYGHSILCGPWVDDIQPPVFLSQHSEQLMTLTVDREEIERVRREYPFLSDRSTGSFLK